MLEQIINILIGAAVASIVPVFTLIKSHSQWRIERKIDFLRLRHTRLEKIYEDCLKHYLSGLQENSFSSEMSADILVYGSKKAKDVFTKYIELDKPSPSQKRHSYLDMAMAAKEHLAEIDKDIESLLS